MIFLWFFSLQILFVNMRVIPQPDELNATKSHDIVEETQHAICKISSKDLEATANATITRQLKGVATTSHLDDRMNILEKTVILEMNNIKQMLDQFVYLLHKSEDQTNQIEMNNFQTQNEINKLEFKTLNHNHSVAKNNYNRESEILNLNMTIQKDNSSIKFMYFWRIDNFVEILSSENAVESGDFYFAGNHLFIRLIPNYLQSEHLLIEVIEIEEFHLSHKFIILDQENAQFDKSSKTLYCGISEDMEMQCAGYEISHEILLSRNYIKDKSIIIQLVIYLDY